MHPAPLMPSVAAAQISLLLPGTRFASTDEWRADVEAKLQEERRLLAEQRAEREAAELQRQEAEYMAAQKVRCLTLYISLCAP